VRLLVACFAPPSGQVTRRTARLPGGRASPVPSLYTLYANLANRPIERGPKFRTILSDNGNLTWVYITR
jgi:hypothetical protein